MPQRRTGTHRRHRNHGSQVIDTNGDTVLYARISEEERAQLNYSSTNAQLDDLARWAGEQGWRVAIKRWDEGFSATELDRPALCEIIDDDGNNPRIKRILVTEYGRFGGTVEFLGVIDRLRSHGVEVKAKYDSIDNATASGEFMLTMLLAVKRFQVKQTGEKISAKIQQRAQKGLWKGGQKPWGFEIDSKATNLVPVMELAPVVRAAHEEFIRTRSFASVADMLARLGVESPNGGAWEWRRVDAMLRCPFFAGLLRVGDELLPAAFPAMIPPELFHESLAARKSRQTGVKPMHPPHPNAKQFYLLSSIVKCDHPGCMAALTPQSNRGKRENFHYYACSRKQRSYRTVNHCNRIRAEVLELFVFEKLAWLSESPDVIASVVELKRRKQLEGTEAEQSELSRLDAAVRRCNDEARAMLDGIASGELRGALLDAANDRFESVKADKERLLSDRRRLAERLRNPFEHFNPETFASNLRDFRGLMTRLPDEQRRYLLRSCVREIGYDREAGYRLELWPDVQKLAKSAGEGVCASLHGWRARRDSNPRPCGP